MVPSITSLNTWNIKGLGIIIKKKKITTNLKKMAIAFLQETYLSPGESEKQFNAPNRRLPILYYIIKTKKQIS